MMRPDTRDAARPAMTADALAKAGARFDRAVLLLREGRLKLARDIFEDLLRAYPGHAPCLHLLGVIASQSGDHARALALIGKAIEIHPHDAMYHYNQAIAHKHLGDLDAAIAAYDRAIAANPAFAEAHSNRGVALLQRGQTRAAIESFGRALAVRPDFVEALYNCGNAQRELGLREAAIESYDRAIAANPDLAEAHYNRGGALNEIDRPEAAVESFDRAAALDPGVEFLAGASLHARMALCDWRDFEPRLADLASRVALEEPAAPPFAMLALADAPALQKLAAQAYVRAKLPADPALGAIARRPRGERIRIGYFSPDFREHPVARLTASLLETHDRNRFEVVGISYGADDGSAMRRRISAAGDTFVDVAHKPDIEIAALAREMGIDIAIDLAGHTQDARIGPFALRAAPVQASYLGYLGTLGASYFDYLFADEIVVPTAARQHYCEKIAYLPSYQAGDAARVESGRRFTREELGLPPEGFVFCCFNNAYKIAPATFASWMRILGRVDGSVLLLHVHNATAIANLRREAQAAGIEPGRLAFAPRVPLAEYLARFRSADLFLDTLPYNAGTVAGDALWAGLPVLTQMGESFASRVGASVLHGIGLPELVTRTREEYEARAVELAANPAALAETRTKLETRRSTAPYFDSAARTRHIEAACSAMYERYHAGRAPEHIEVIAA